MQFHQFKPHAKLRRARRVGRGGKRGTTSGRGTKGQRARAGAKIRPALRDVVKRLPKKRGYRFRSFRPKPAVVSLDAVTRRFQEGQPVDSAALYAKGLVRKIKGRTPEVKILSSAAISKKLVFRGVKVSAAAGKAIRSAGGRIE